jgi:hypothetical protein
MAHVCMHDVLQYTTGVRFTDVNVGRVYLHGGFEWEPPSRYALSSGEIGADGSAGSDAAIRGMLSTWRIRWGSKIKNPEQSGINGPMPLQQLAPHWWGVDV